STRPGHHDIGPSPQGLADRAPRRAPHDDVVPRGGLPKPAKIGGQMPRELALATDEPVAIHRDDETDEHGNRRRTGAFAPPPGSTTSAAAFRGCATRGCRGRGARSRADPTV